MKAPVSHTVKIPEGVTVSYANEKITVTGPKGEVSRAFYNPQIKIASTGENATISAEQATKRERRLILTLKSHLQNMIKGVIEPWTYLLKICSSHFPMNVKVEGRKIIVKNFLGEKTPREAPLPEGATVKIQGNDVVVESVSLEKAGNIAGRIELLTKVSNRDKRIFQDGIYITKKGKQQ